MNREEIIRMAQAAGLGNGINILGIEKFLERFFHMAQAAEREVCAKVCEDDAWRCKKIAVETQDKKANAAAIEASLCAAAIRARGNQ